MATVSSKLPRQFEYPTSDGKPMAETEFHRDLMIDLIESLKIWFAAKPRVYVSGNLLMYHEPGNKRKHVSPDVFIVRGVSKKKRLYYLTWKEGKTPAAVIELTSSSTCDEDKKTKFALYRDVLKVKEYFLFDPFGEYLQPRLQGYRLHDGEYVPMTLVEGRMPSRVLGLQLEPAEWELRLYNPESGEWLPRPRELVVQEKARADQEKARADQEKARADHEKAWAVQEKARADRAAIVADEEKTRADQAEREKLVLTQENAKLAEEKVRLAGEYERQLLDKLLREKKNGR